LKAIQKPTSAWVTKLLHTKWERNDAQFLPVSIPILLLPRFPSDHTRVCLLSGDRLFSRACCDRTRGKGFKLRESRFRLDTRKNFFTVRVVKHWTKLPREVGDASSLETFEARLDGALSNLV